MGILMLISSTKKLIIPSETFKWDLLSGAGQAINKQSEHPATRDPGSLSMGTLDVFLARQTNLTEQSIKKSFCFIKHFHEPEVPYVKY